MKIETLVLRESLRYPIKLQRNLVDRIGLLSYHNKDENWEKKNYVGTSVQLTYIQGNLCKLCLTQIKHLRGRKRFRTNSVNRVPMVV